ncbi:MAG TPA: hypothetical protein VFS43_24805 [Polyangiaceae bacterium]|nr:hypothetical protein [Polyangiaceae bacterium]
MGQSVESFLSATELQTAVMRKILVQSGFPPRVVSTDWYPQARWLAALRFIAEAIGENTLLAVGKRIVDSAAWPEEVTTIDAGLASIDVAYHMNHRINGAPLFDPATGTMTEGIGHYQYCPAETRRAVMVCHNPYPSDMDRGIILAVARKFKPAAEVSLDESKPTRKRGGESCTYHVTW